MFFTLQNVYNKGPVVIYSLSYKLSCCSRKVAWLRYGHMSIGAEKQSGRLIYESEAIAMSVTGPYCAMYCRWKAWNIGKGQGKIVGGQILHCMLSVLGQHVYESRKIQNKNSILVEITINHAYGRDTRLWLCKSISNWLPIARALYTGSMLLLVVQGWLKILNGCNMQFVHNSVFLEIIQSGPYWHNLLCLSLHGDYPSSMYLGKVLTAHVAQPMLFKWTRQLGQSGQHIKKYNLIEFYMVQGRLKFLKECNILFPSNPSHADIIQRCIYWHKLLSAHLNTDRGLWLETSACTPHCRATCLPAYALWVGLSRL